jgi:hypothetical protein
MEKKSYKQPEIEPFEFQNRTVYRDLLKLMTTIRELNTKVSGDLGKKFLGDLFHALFFVSKEVAYSTHHKDKVEKMNLLVSSIPKIFDCMTALDICFEARWIPALEYFESKQILEKTYWTLSSELDVVYEELETFKEEFQSKMEQFQ